MNIITSFWSTKKEQQYRNATIQNNYGGLQSGGGHSFWKWSSDVDSKVEFGYSLVRGKRNTMEDCQFSEFLKHSESGDVVGCFGVFDGHGGPSAANFVKNSLFQSLLANNKFISDIEAAVRDAYSQTDQMYLELDRAGKEDGCTAVSVTLHKDQLCAANVGDSRAVLCRLGKAIELSVDHKPNMPDERERIENAGGVVVWAGTWRVGGVLAVSRAFGDKPLKKYVVSDPNVRVMNIDPEQDELVVLASDGLWDVITNQEAVVMARDSANAQAAARKLSDEAYSRGSNDNITCVVVKFNA